MRKYYILTYGCQMNKNDSERIAGLLSSLGFTEVSSPEEGDILIINTCSVRQSAEDRVCGMMLNWQELRHKNPNLIIAVTGCMPGRDKDGKLRRKISGVDLWFGIDELPRLPVWLNELNTGADEAGDYLNITPVRESSAQGFITIQTGCNNFCTYCVVPHARGRERNRTVKGILAEARDFAAKGGLEVTLLGQVVNHYVAPDPKNFSENNPFIHVIPAPDRSRGQAPAGIQSHGLLLSGSPVRPGMTIGASTDCHFSALLWELNQIDGLRRIHFTAPDPQYINETQIEALKLPKQMNYIHLPVQSGDNEILRKMNRKYTREQYIDIIKKIRAARPEMAIGTDIIVGFCGETDKQFQNTLDLYRECDFDISYNAMYSERSGTPAAKAFKDDVPRKIKKQRWDALQEMMEQIVYKKNQKYAGQTVEVLVENYAPLVIPAKAGIQSGWIPDQVGNDKLGLCSGNSREMKLVQFIGTPDLAGKIVKVKIFDAREWILKGELIK